MNKARLGNPWKTELQPESEAILHERDPNITPHLTRTMMPLFDVEGIRGEATCREPAGYIQSNLFHALPLYFCLSPLQFRQIKHTIELQGKKRRDGVEILVFGVMLYIKQTANPSGEAIGPTAQKSEERYFKLHL